MMLAALSPYDGVWHTLIRRQDITDTTYVAGWGHVQRYLTWRTRPSDYLEKKGKNLDIIDSFLNLLENEICVIVKTPMMYP